MTGSPSFSSKVPTSGTNSASSSAPFHPETTSPTTSLGRTTLSSHSIFKSIHEQLRRLNGSLRTSQQEEKNRKTTLIIDGLDFLLAASSGEQNGGNVLEMLDAISSLQEHTDTLILALAADSPLLPQFNPTTHVTGSPTPLETAHLALLTSLAHRASLVLSCRELDTGVARDVSGILRVTKGGAGLLESGITVPGDGGGAKGGRDEETDEEWKEIEEGEFLYYVGGGGSGGAGGGGRSTSDGGVRVWRRGEGLGAG
ncbi:MAG: hypothetical protein M1837_000779 [Sclerophora amabilis]|nr:MAG: hypothetical protein M1837_000779 [Sclerophora amabilis]